MVKLRLFCHDQLGSSIAFASGIRNSEERQGKREYQFFIVMQFVTLLIIRPLLPESAKKTLATMYISRTLEKKIIKNLFSTMKNIQETLLIQKINESTHRTPSTDTVTKGENNNISKALLLLSDTSNRKDLKYKSFYKWKVISLTGMQP